MLIVDPQKINYELIRKKCKIEEKGHIIWVAFVNTGHVAVVGAGTDISFSKNKKRGAWRVLCELDVEWYEEKVIIVPVRKLDNKSNGLKNVNNVLNCRNGVEHCIGEYLIEKKVSILNYYSHKNYSDRYWNECEQRKYKKNTDRNFLHCVEYESNRIFKLVGIKMDKDKSKIISDIATMLIENNKVAAKTIICQEYPHTYYEIEKRTYTTTQKMNQFLKDGFIDRYSGKKTFKSWNFKNIITLFSRGISVSSSLKNG